MREVDAAARGIALALLLILLVVPPASASQGIIPLHEATRRQLPQGLPWYLVAFWGDCRPASISGPSSLIYPRAFVDILNELDQIRPQVMIGGGDFVSFGTESQYAAFYNLTSSHRIENFLPVMGNHEIAYGPQSADFYAKYIGPYNATIVFDDVPGWRIAILNSEVTDQNLNLGTSAWISMLEQAYEGLGNRSLILAFHKPLYPFVNHQIDPDLGSILDSFLANASVKPALVLQSHWHGFAINSTNSTVWLISGGAGAPLYPASDCGPGATCVSTYNYILMTLYPNGTYRLYPLKVGSNAGNLTVSCAGTTCIVNNTKRDVYGNYTDVPVRIAITYGNYTIYVVGIAPANSTSRVSLDPLNAILSSDLADFYAYVETAQGAVVFQAAGNAIDLSSIIPRATPSTTSASPATSSPTTSTPTTSMASPTSPASATSPTTSPATTPSTATSAPQSSYAPAPGGPSASVVIAVAVAVAVVAAALVLALALRRKR
ncbi:MAG: metallophosphoesterase [Desulfurococcaceae archaeon]